MTDAGDQLPLGVRRRLEFIDFRLRWEGRIRRKDITEEFHISVPQASADLGEYLRRAPGNMVYDTTHKAYLAPLTFQPAFRSFSADRLLLQFRAVFNRLIAQEDTWIGRLPPLGVVPEVRRPVEEACLRLMLRAIRSRCEVDMEYQSLRHEEPSWRTIVPHALAFDGFRWHVRAWCKTTAAFKDFVIARMLDIGAIREGFVAPDTDHEWNRDFTLRLAPNPQLPTAQRRAVELDYGMKEGVREVTTKIALAFYLIRQLNLDLDATQANPARLQLVLLNRDEFEAARAEARAQSAPAANGALPSDRGA